MAGTGFLKSGPCRCIETYIERIRLTEEYICVELLDLQDIDRRHRCCWMDSQSWSIAGMIRLDLQCVTVKMRWRS